MTRVNLGVPVSVMVPKRTPHPPTPLPLLVPFEEVVESRG